jgi:hypothetical protein
MYCFSFWNLFVEFQPTQMVDFSLLAVWFVENAKSIDMVSPLF